MVRPLYGLSTVCKEWYIALKRAMVKDTGGEATSRDKSVFVLDDSDCDSNTGEGLRGKCAGDNGGMDFLESMEVAVLSKWGGVFGVSISHVGDLVIFGHDMSIRILSGEMEEHSAAKVSAASDALYWGVRITKVKNDRDASACIQFTTNDCGVKFKIF